MKHVNKLLSFVLVLALTCSLTSGFVSKAAGTITVTLRIEQDDSTLLPPVSDTLTEEDKNEIINGLNSLILYNDCYKEVFGSSFSEDYDMTSPDAILEFFKDSLESSYIDIVED